MAYQCPTCDRPLPARPTATFYAAGTRRHHYWCDHCRAFKLAHVRRDYDREDNWQDDPGPVLWDLGAGLPDGHPFAQPKAA